MANKLEPKIFTVGAAVHDTFLRSPAFQVIHSAEFPSEGAQCVALGAKIESDLLVQSSGGGATNAAVTFARLGLGAAVISNVGDDEQGAAIIDQLEREGVNTDFINTVAAGQTGHSTVLLAGDGERSIITFRGVSKDWSNASLPVDLGRAELIYVTSLGGHLDTLSAIIKQASNKARIFLNPGADEISKRAELLPLLAKVDTLIVNLEEGRALSGEAGDMVKVARALHQHAPRVVVTDGPRGAVVVSDEGSYRVQAGQTPSVSTTGAGDAFGSAFAAAIHDRRTLDEALRVAALNAASVIGHIGAKVGILKAWPSDHELSAVKIEAI